MTCGRCHGKRFTVEVREGQRYVYGCAACNPRPDRPEYRRAVRDELAGRRSFVVTAFV